MDFLWVQLDTEFRKMWDKSATKLEIIEECSERNSDLVYWEMQWPVIEFIYNLESNKTLIAHSVLMRFFYL